MKVTVAVIVGLVLSAPTFGLVPWASAEPDSGQYVVTESGLVRCWIEPAEVACERTSADGFPQAPVTASGGHWNLAIVNTAGAFSWNDGNISARGDDVILRYGQPYHYFGWTILPSSDGTRFTNDGTGHGMFVSVENVNAF